MGDWGGSDNASTDNGRDNDDGGFFGAVGDFFGDAYDAAADFFGGGDAGDVGPGVGTGGDRQGDAPLGGRGGGSKGGRALTEREAETSPHRQALANPQTFAELQDRIDTQGRSGFTTFGELEELGLEAEETTLGIKLTSPAGRDVSKNLGLIAGEEYSVPAETFTRASPRERRTIGQGLGRGTIRAARPDADSPFERSTIGRLFGAAEAAQSLFGLVSGAPGVYAAGKYGGTKAGLLAASTQAPSLLGFGDIVGIFDEEDTLVSGGFLGEFDRSKSPTTRTGEGDGGIAELPEYPVFGNAEIPAVTPGTTPGAPLQTGTPRKPRRGFTSTVRTGFFGIGVGNVRRAR